nr:MAG TPA: hypothetical protein [Caudoviricetes sp.]
MVSYSINPKTGKLELYYSGRKNRRPPGGPEFILPGVIVKLARFGYAEVLRNIDQEIFCRHPSGYCFSAPYTDILEITNCTHFPKQFHPFRKGETFTLPLRQDWRAVETTYKILKSTKKRVTILNTATGERFRRTPHLRPYGIGTVGNTWWLVVAFGYEGSVCRPAT